MLGCEEECSCVDEAVQLMQSCFTNLHRVCHACDFFDMNVQALPFNALDSTHTEGKTRGRCLLSTNADLVVVRGTRRWIRVNS
eukprot:m.196148 g.196148  ORF g.196148 m.196148 type:complete len:83 (+) comp14902_c1_seq3:1102-1350(+)